MSANGASREAIVHETRSWIGTPYVHQASLIGVGCDCLGLVRGVWRGVIGVEPEQAGAYAPDWAEASGVERMLLAADRHFVRAHDGNLQAGDLLIFRWRANLPAKHAAIATSRETMVHAHEGASVCEVTIAPAWRRRLAGIFSFPGVSA